MGFSVYFLIVWDLIAPRPRDGHPGRPGPRSAAGCAVAYCLRITDLDPIRYDLLFERFLNPSRISMPDIDMDFDSRYRDEMIRYAAESYGRDHVAQIVTFATIKARDAVRDAARVLGLPVRRGRQGRQGHAAAGHGPRHAAQALLRAAPEVRRRLQGGRRAPRDVRGRPRRASGSSTWPRGLEGLKRPDGIHAAAVVITKDPLTDYLADPAQARVRPGPRGGPGRHPVRDARRRGARPAEDGLPGPAQPRRHHRHRRDDPGPRDPGSTSTDRPRRPGTFELLQRGDTIGVFQLEGAADAGADAVARPTTFEDVARADAPCTGPARWRPTCTTTTPTARTGASRSSTCTPTPRRCSATPTG